MSIADQLALHVKQELDHALIISRQIEYLGKMPIATPKPVKTLEKAEEMLRSDLANETETIRNYRVRVQQCEQLGEHAMAEQIRQILVDEQDHQIDLATALGEEVPATEAPKVKRARSTRGHGFTTEDTESAEKPGCEDMTDGEVGSLEHPSELEVNRQVHRL